MSFTCGEHGWRHGQSPCQICIQIESMGQGVIKTASLRATVQEGNMKGCKICSGYGAMVITFKFDPCQLDHVGIGGPRPCVCVTDRINRAENLATLATRARNAAIVFGYASQQMKDAIMAIDMALGTK